ncbi:MAG: hypothetical protein LBP20_02125 [Treponema sp.]|jgi:hypothetical protein|nr:hypothetical protein [Treponema sp.]
MNSTLSFSQNPAGFGKRFFLVFVLAAVLVAPGFAANVYIVVAETGGGEEKDLLQEQQEAGFESSSLWEACLLDIFFEAGHVVSNSPILSLGAEIPEREVSSADFPAELNAELEEARSGGADYVVVALLSYPAAVDRKTRPEQVRLRLYTLEPYRFVWENSLVRLARTENETAQAQRLIRELIPHIEAAVTKF